MKSGLMQDPKNLSRIMMMKMKMTTKTTTSTTEKRTIWMTWEADSEMITLVSDFVLFCDCSSNAHYRLRLKQ